MFGHFASFMGSLNKSALEMFIETEQINVN